MTTFTGIFCLDLFQSHMNNLLWDVPEKGSNGTEKLADRRKEERKKQEAHGPRVAHLSDIATADMQMLCNIFPVLSSQLMKRSTFKQFLILKKNIIYGMTVNGV